MSRVRTRKLFIKEKSLGIPNNVCEIKHYKPPEMIHLFAFKRHFPSTIEHSINNLEYEYRATLSRKIFFNFSLFFSLHLLRPTG